MRHNYYKFADEEWIIIDTNFGPIHVVNNSDGTTEIVIYDHLDINIDGKRKHNPTITISEDEFKSNIVEGEKE